MKNGLLDVLFMLNFSSILPSLGFIIEGALITLKFTGASLLCGLPFGVLIAALKISNIGALKKIGNVYTTIFRGTPILVQLGLFYYGTPQLTGYSISAFEAGVLSFSLNSAAYTSEIIRAGIESIDEGQWSAAQVLGISKYLTFIKIILPQAIRNILPALINEMINLLKESALVSTIGECDLLRRAMVIAGEKYLYFEPLLIVAFIYFMIVCIMEYCARFLEEKLRYA